MADPADRPILPDVRSELAERAAPPFVEGPSQAAPVEVRSIVPPEVAYENGLAEGERRGREAATKELAPAIEELQGLGRALADVRAQRLAAAEDDLLDVATELARRVLRGELEQGSDAVLRLARACIQEAADESEITLRVAPADVELVQTHLPDLETDLADGAIRLVADPSIARGSVVLETPRRCYEGRPDRILEEARARLDAEEAAK